MAEKLPKMPDVKSTNPRYKGAMMSDVARALVTDPKVRARLEEPRSPVPTAERRSRSSWTRAEALVRTTSRIAKYAADRGECRFGTTELGWRP